MSLKLGEIITFKRGYDLPDQVRINGKYPIVTSAGISSYHHQYKVKGPCVITGRYGTLGLVHYVDQECWPLNTTLYVKDFKGNDPKYVFYFLKTLKLEEFNGGSAVPGLDRNVLHKIDCVFLTNINKQREISSLLSCYDNLISLNNSRIKSLMDLASGLYKEWFVRMRFPGYGTTKFEKGIPNDWELKSFKDIITLKNGKEAKLSTNDNSSYTVYGSNGVIGKSEYYNYENVIIIGRVGAYCGSIEFADKKIWATDNTLVAIPDRTYNNRHFCYFLLKNHNLGNFAGGSAQPLLTQGIINNMKTLVPAKELILMFDNIIEPFFRQIENLTQQNIQLRQICDRLIPRLISGKLNVKTLGEEVLHTTC